ncbi:MAG: hypothetical protein DRN30_02215 [Thermoplasmata archaeon]|nr:MAG: hypothetical protein DRN30_02215 [Thermoplasmata archaeon]
MRVNGVDKKKLFLEAYRKSFGNISAACRAVGIRSRTTVYKWMKRNKRFKKALDEIDQSFVEFVESKLFQKISEGNLQAIKFFLINRAPDRWRDGSVMIQNIVQNQIKGGEIDDSDRELQEDLLGQLRERFGF